MSRFDFSAVGRPQHEHTHHGFRAAASLFAALAGGLALLLLGFALLGSVSPAEAGWTFLAAAVLVAIWLTGIWWRWDSPGARDPHRERERRGF